MTATFAHLGLPEALVRALGRRNIETPFPIQAAAIPDALAGRDILGKAPTGSGKTLAFGLPTLARVDKARRHRPSALILAPTRELAEQIKKELQPLASASHRHVAAVYGGVGYGPQKHALRRGVDILVATPGRLEDLIEQGSVELGNAGIVVVDEADRMADMGFLPAVRRILDQTPADRQTLLFSATLDGEVSVVSRAYQRDPVRHEADALNPETMDAAHHFWLVRHADRIQHTVDVVEATGQAIVFTRTRRGADRLAKQVVGHGVGAVALHGGRSQNQRNRALQAFASGKAQALIATDVAARGIHIDAVDSVIHYDMPHDAKDYVHRSGRTARAGATGTVVSLITHEQRRSARRMQRHLDLDEPIAEPRIDVLRAGAPADRKDRPQRPEHEPRSRPRRSETKTTSLYVANLPWSASEADLRSLFSGHGDVHDTTVITDKQTGRSKGFGFVDMPAPAAERAVDKLHGTDFGGRDLTVRVAKPSRYAG